MRHSHPVSRSHADARLTAIREQLDADVELALARGDPRSVVVFCLGESAEAVQADVLAELVRCFAGPALWLRRSGALVVGSCGRPAGDTAALAERMVAHLRARLDVAVAAGTSALASSPPTPGTQPRAQPRLLAFQRALYEAQARLGAISRRMLLEGCREERRAFDCPVSGHPVTCAFQRDARTGERVAVTECSAFGCPAEVACDRLCLRYANARVPLERGADPAASDEPLD